jgi:hypothetical protein
MQAPEGGVGGGRAKQQTARHMSYVISTCHGRYEMYYTQHATRKGNWARGKGQEARVVEQGARAPGDEPRSYTAQKATGLWPQTGRWAMLGPVDAAESSRGRGSKKRGALRQSSTSPHINGIWYITYRLNTHTPTHTAHTNTHTGRSRPLPQGTSGPAPSSCATSTTNADRLGLRALNAKWRGTVPHHLAPTFRPERPQEVTSLDHPPAASIPL